MLDLALLFAGTITGVGSLIHSWLGEGEMPRPGLEGAERVERRQTAGHRTSLMDKFFLFIL